MREYLEIFPDKNKHQNLLNKLFPTKVYRRGNISGARSILKKVNLLTKEERHRLVSATKTLSLSSSTGFNEAIITVGGVEVSQINPKTMESKSVKGVFLCRRSVDLMPLQ